MVQEHLHEDLDRKECLECHREFTGIVAACPHDNSMLVPLGQRDPLIGTKLAGKYEILSLLGTGGMGVVYKGRQDIMDRIVAIKMLQSHFLNDSANVKRFQQEGRATCKLNHPHIITVYDFGISQQSGQPFIVMDYLQGVPLSDVIKQEGQVSVDRAVKIFIQAAEALGHAHKQGVVHRDLKPSNIVLINYDGDKDFVKVVDFGVAQLMEDTSGEGRQRLTQMGEVCGSPVYMSPEQCQGVHLDSRSDIYSMGVVMFETLTNRLPLLGKTMVETMRRHIEETPPPFSKVRPDLYIPERVEQVILKAMAKSPDDRFQSMEQLAKELELAIPKPGRSQVLRTTPLETEETKESISSDLGKVFMGMTTTHLAIAVVSVLVLAGLVGGVIFMLMKSPDTGGDTTKPAPTISPEEKSPEQKPAATSPAATVAPASKPDPTQTGDKPDSDSQTPDKSAQPADSETQDDANAETTPAKTPAQQQKPVEAKPKPQPKPKPKPVKASTPKPKPQPKPKKSNVWSELESLKSY